jgi:hypothetical protein
VATVPELIEHSGGGSGVVEHEAGLAGTSDWQWQDPPGRWLHLVDGQWRVADPGEAPPGS